MAAKKRPPKRGGRKPRTPGPSLLGRLTDPTVVAFLIAIAAALAVYLSFRGLPAERASSGKLARSATTPRPSRPTPAEPRATTAAPTNLHPTPARPTPSPLPGRPQPSPALPAPTPIRTANAPRVAIIIDDLGNDIDTVRRATDLRQRLTFAVIPHLRYSKEAAELLHARGFEIMLHLPMEPEDPHNDPGEGAVLERMEGAEIHAVVERDLAAVPWIRGVNNHMGSRLTADPRRMRFVLEALRGTPYYFVDSRTSAESVAFAVARELSVPTAQRAVFLDNVEEESAVRKQLEVLVARARADGVAVGIGHIKPLTVRVLAAWLPEAERRGVRFVYASEVVS